MSIPQVSSVKVHVFFGAEGIFRGTRDREGYRLTGAPVSLPLRDTRGRREKPAGPSDLVRRLDISYDKSRHLESFYQPPKEETRSRFQSA